MSAVATPGRPAPAAAHRPRPGTAVRRLWRGAESDPRWARPALWGLLLATAVLYLAGLSASGWANAFYSAAVQAGSQSWKAFFFGSSDAANFITVDKPPAALWPMALSVRLFGLSSWAILAPQALMGVASVAVLYAAVRRRFGAAAGLLAGAVLALTPVAVLMFRFNNPDALLALLMVCALYAVQRALEAGRTRWLVWAGVFVGLAFLTKTLQAFLILPVLALVYGVCAPVPVRRRIGQLLLAGAALVVSGGWWVAIVELWPASSRPYIGGSQHNSFLELTFGYNGFGRLSGDETGSVGGMGGPGGAGGTGGTGGGMWGQTGLTRLFGSEIGGQVAWLLPAAALLLVAGLVVTRRAPRTDPARSALLLWGGSLLVTFAVFSYMAGIFHPYYTVALAPYIAAVTGMGAALLWERRRRPAGALTLGLVIAVTAVWSYVLLARDPQWYPPLRWAVLAGGLLAAVAVAVAGLRSWRWPLAAAVALAVAASLAGPAAYAVSTAATGHTGSLPSAGPAGSGGPGGGMGGGPGRMGGAAGARGGGAMGPGGTRPGGTLPQGFGGGAGTAPGGAGGFPGAMGAAGAAGGFPGAPGTGTGTGTGTAPGARAREAGGMGGGLGGLLDGAQVSAAAKALLRQDADRYTWVAATVGSQNQASYQLATGDPVMAIGGFNGSDPAPSLAQFQAYVAAKRIHYFIAGGGMGGNAMGTTTNVSAQITSWVEAHFTKRTAGGATVYDLTAPTG